MTEKMSIETARETLEEHRRLLGNEDFYDEEIEAIRVVLDELKALQNRPECACLREGGWCQK